MITDSNIQKAKDAYLKAKTEHGKVQLDHDAFNSYVEQIESGLWDANSNLPMEGPLTVAQAAMIDVVIPNDKTMPQVFAYPEVHTRAKTLLSQLSNSLKLYKDDMDAKRETLSKMEEQYAEDLERAQEIAKNDPAVAEAKANAEAEKVKADKELALEKMKAESKRENRKLIVFGLAGLLVVSIVIMVVAKVVKR